MSAFGASVLKSVILPAINVDLTCYDLYDNAGGDWTGPIAGQLDVNGNISEDRLFCDLPALDLTPQSDSPCAPDFNPECGLIGAGPVGCGPSSTVPCTGVR